MIKELLKMGGVKTQKEFYEKYPTEESFLEAFPQARPMLMQRQTGGANMAMQPQTSGNQSDEQKQMIMQAIAMYAKMNNMDPEALIKQLSELPQEQQIEAVQNIIQTVQQAMQSEEAEAAEPGQMPMNPEEAMMAAYGGSKLNKFMKNGGGLAFPQQPTADRFFSYGPKTPDIPRLFQYGGLNKYQTDGETKCGFGYVRDPNTGECVFVGAAYPKTSTALGTTAVGATAIGAIKGTEALKQKIRRQAKPYITPNVPYQKQSSYGQMDWSYVKNKIQKKFPEITPQAWANLSTKERWMYVQAVENPNVYKIVKGSMNMVNKLPKQVWKSPWGKLGLISAAATGIAGLIDYFTGDEEVPEDVQQTPQTMGERSPEEIKFMQQYIDSINAAGQQGQAPFIPIEDYGPQDGMPDTISVQKQGGVTPGPFNYGYFPATFLSGGEADPGISKPDQLINKNKSAFMDYLRNNVDNSIYENFRKGGSKKKGLPKAQAGLIQLGSTNPSWDWNPSQPSETQKFIESYAEQQQKKAPVIEIDPNLVQKNPVTGSAPGEEGKEKKVECPEGYEWDEEKKYCYKSAESLVAGAITGVNFLADIAGKDEEQRQEAKMRNMYLPDTWNPAKPGGDYGDYDQWGNFRPNKMSYARNYVQPAQLPGMTPSAKTGGDVTYLTDDQIKKLIESGGQVEFLD